MSAIKGYCIQCQKPLYENGYKITKRGKICLACLGTEPKAKPLVQPKDTAQAHIKEGQRKQLYSFLLAYFCVGEIPESWTYQIDVMLKKGYSFEGIINAIKYSATKTELTSDNWVGRVYVYYEEAEHFYQKQAEILANNEQVTLENTVRKFTISDTRYRDTPSYNIEDL